MYEFLSTYLAVTGIPSAAPAAAAQIPAGEPAAVFADLLGILMQSGTLPAVPAESNPEAAAGATAETLVTVAPDTDDASSPAPGTPGEAVPAAFVPIVLPVDSPAKPALELAAAMERPPVEAAPKPAALAAAGKGLPPTASPTVPTGAVETARPVEIPPAANTVAEDAVDVGTAVLRATVAVRQFETARNPESATIPQPARVPEALTAAVPVSNALPPERMVAAAPISVPVGNPRWAEAFAERVVWLVGEQRGAAEIRVNPPLLGPIEVKLTVANGEASAIIHAPHAATREAIENAVPRLREMFAAAGLELGQVDVGTGQTRQPAADAREPYLKAVNLVSDDQELRVAATTPGLPRGLVDLYA